MTAWTDAIAVLPLAVLVIVTVIGIDACPGVGVVAEDAEAPRRWVSPAR